MISLIVIFTIFASLSSVKATCHLKLNSSDGFEELPCLDMDVKEFDDRATDGSRTNELIVTDSCVKPSQVEQNFPKLETVTSTYHRFIKEDQVSTANFDVCIDNGML